MKKLFTFAIALMATVAMNATDYYLAGSGVGWSDSNPACKFVDVDGVLTLEVADLYGEIKVVTPGWHPQYGAVMVNDTVVPIALNTPYVLGGERSDGEAINLPIDLQENYRIKDAKLTLTIVDSVFTLNIVEGTPYDHSATPVSYYLVGGCTNNWSLADAIEFVEVEGVLTANVPDLNGTFKIIKDRAWGTEYCSNGTGVELGVDYLMPLGGSNIALANPFGGYTDAVLTLTISGDDHILKLVSGTFYVTENNWYIPGSKLGWNCNETTMMSPVEGVANTYEILLAEFGGEFKVVYGQWAVEFGAPKGETGDWTANQSYELAFPCDNMKPADPDATYQDVTITLVVDYANVAATLTIATEEQGFETIELKAKSIKRIENGMLVIENNGVRYNVNGAKQ